MTKYIDPNAKLLQHIDRLATLKANRYTPPVNVEIDLSNRCSLGCEWCHFGYTHTRGPLAGKREKPDIAMPGGDLMDFELAKRIVSSLALNQIRSITWTGGGEPTLHPRFDDIIRHAHEQHIDQGLYTHGGHITPDRAALLKRALTWVYVSLDCADRETYAETKGVDRFEAACLGINHLAYSRGDATIGVGFLIHADNYQYIDNMINLAHGLGADYAQLRPAVYFDIHDPAERASNIEWIEEAWPILEKAARRDKVIVDLNRFRMYRTWQGHGYQVCYWAGLQTVITPDGSMWACVNKREIASAWLGNLAEEPFETIWAKAGGTQFVDETCRVLCRGHVPNVALTEIMGDLPHRNFI